MRSKEEIEKEELEKLKEEVKNLSFGEKLSEDYEAEIVKCPECGDDRFVIYSVQNGIWYVYGMCLGCGKISEIASE